MKNTDRLRKKNGSASASETIEKLTVPGSIIIEDDKRRNRTRPGFYQLEEIVNRVTSAVNDNMAMMELLPDLRLVKKILVPSILSPKDMSAVSFRLSIDSTVYTEQVDATLIGALETHFRTTFDLEGKLSQILEEALFDTGSYCMAILPESGLVDLIKNNNYVAMESMESMVEKNRSHFRPIGLLSGSRETPLNTLKINVTDNPNHLLAKELRRRTISKEVMSRLTKSVAMEWHENVPTMGLNVTASETGKRKTNPLVVKIPSDAVVPVFVPSDPKDHLGYFILLDENGSPITNVKSENHMEKLKQQIENAARGNSLGGLIQSTGFVIGNDLSRDTKKLGMATNTLIDHYIKTVDDELAKHLKNGVYGSEVEVSRPQEIYRMMLSRYLSQKMTRLVYIPKEVVSYIAFDFNTNGVGKSLLEDGKIFGSLRAILMFAQVMAGVKNSVGRTKLDITLDEDDPDPATTIDGIIHHFAGLQTEALPLGNLVAGDIVRSLQKASVDVSINGGEAFPGTKSEVSEISRDFKSPDQDLAQTLRRMQYSGFGVPPEIIDSAMEGELATVVVSRNLLYAKQVIEYATRFEKMITDFVTTYIRCSGELMGIIREIVAEKDIELFLSSLKFTLPTPDLAGVKSQMDAFTQYSEAIDKALDSYITEDMFRSLVSGSVDTAALAALRVTFGDLLKREWMAQQNIFTDIPAKLNDPDVADRINEHNKTTLTVLGDVLKRILNDEEKIRESTDKVKKSIEEKQNADNATDGDENSTTGDTESGSYDTDSGEGTESETGEETGEAGDTGDEDTGETGELDSELSDITGDTEEGAEETEEGGDEEATPESETEESPEEEAPAEETPTQTAVAKDQEDTEETEEATPEEEPKTDEETDKEKEPEDTDVEKDTQKDEKKETETEKPAKDEKEKPAETKEKTPPEKKEKPEAKEDEDVEEEDFDVDKHMENMDKALGEDEEEDDEDADEDKKKAKDKDKGKDKK